MVMMLLCYIELCNCLIKSLFCQRHWLRVELQELCHWTTCDLDYLVHGSLCHHQTLLGQKKLLRRCCTRGEVCFNGWALAFTHRHFPQGGLCPHTQEVWSIIPLVSSTDKNSTQGFANFATELLCLFLREERSLQTRCDCKRNPPQSYISDNWEIFPRTSFCLHMFKS